MGTLVAWFQSLLSQGISLLFRQEIRGQNRFGEFQSLLSQGISLLNEIRRPVLLRTGLFQSLLSQGISLLVGVFRNKKFYIALVSIPS